ncbi:MAG TPA: ATP-binding protein [Chitinophagaceae bacterium]
MAFTATGELVYSNPLASKLLANLPLDHDALFTGMNCETFRLASEKCSEDPDTTVTIEASYPQAAHSDVIVEWEISALVGEDGNVESIQAIGCRRESETAIDVQQEVEQRFRHLISDLNFGVTVRDGKGKALLCNKIALEAIGRTDEEFLASTIPLPLLRSYREDGTIMPAEDFPTVRALATKRPVEDVVIGYVNDDQTVSRWFLTSAVPVLRRNGDIQYVITTFSDITERKVLEDQVFFEEINRHKLITRAAVDAQERERKEIGKELHDNINQILTTALLHLELAASANADESRQLIRNSAKFVSTSIDEIRKLSKSLTPVSLGDLGLLESVRDLCESLRATHVFDIRFHHHKLHEQNLAEDIRLTIFRIIQEQIKNIVLHSAATAVSIRLETRAGQVKLVISDNGRGFDTTTVKRGLGLNNIIHRAEIFNGHVDICSRPGQGCNLTVTLPLQS